MSTPDSHTDSWKYTASEALPLLKSGELKATDYAKALLHRIRVRDPTVKAWVYLSPAQILRSATALDDVGADKRGPLHGLPIAVKDVVLTKDYPTQYNSRLYESEDAINMDANVIMTLRMAGALIFGKTATTEFATTKQGDFHQNHTTNVHDYKRTPGGSSSGSGAAVGDFQAPVAIGTQTGGSIVRPASFNGCYGYKPTWGSISTTGISQWSVTLDTCGFFTRSVQDLESLADIFLIRDDEQVPEEPFELKGAKFGFYKSHYWSNAGPGTVKAMDTAKQILEKHGATVEDVDVPEDFAKVPDWHSVVATGEGRSSYLGQYRTDKTLLHEDIVDQVENKKGFSRKDQLEAYDNCARLRPVFDEKASQYAAIITPSVVDEAPLGYSTGDMNFCSTWTMMHVPALNIPGFAGENSLPIGLTAVAPRFRDRHLLHVARTLGPIFEDEGGWKRNVVQIRKEPQRRASTGYRST